MKLNRQYTGEKKIIYYLVLDNGDCPAMTFMEKLKADNEVSNKAMVRRITNHAKIGSTQIFKQGHQIRGNLFVWKTKQGARLLYFQLPNSHCVVTHGYYKGDPERVQYQRAENLRGAYFAQGER